MASNELKIVVRAVDDASDELAKVQSRLNSFGADTEKVTKKAVPLYERLSGQLGALTIAGAGATIATSRLTNEFEQSITAANRYQGAMTGLTTVARAFNQDANKAKEAAAQLASDGLMTVTEAATGLKNLLASHFSLDEAITLMNRFKDSAAFNRQASLSFGEAVASATEGIKNGNSILVDNAGVTKNLSVILEEAGYSAQDLMKATTDAGVRQALFNGILKETNPQLGDAARLTEQFAGKQAQLNAQTLVLRQRIGDALQKALLPILEAITPLVVKLSDWIAHHEKLAAAIAIATLIMLGLVAAVAAIGAIIIAIGPIIAAFGAAAVAVAAGIAAAFAVAAATVLVNWEAVKNFFTVTLPGAFNGVMSWFGGLPGWIRSALSSIPDTLINLFTGGTVGVLRTVYMMADSIVGRITALPGQIGGAIGGIFSALTSPFSNALGTIRGIVDQIASTANNIKSRVGNFLGGLKIPGFASGVQNFSGGVALVGEQGPELVTLPRGANVYPAQQTAQMLGGSAGQTFNNTFIVNNQVDMDASIRELGWLVATR